MTRSHTRLGFAFFWFVTTVFSILLVRPARAASEAYLGEPFGVGRISLRLPADQDSLAWQTGAWAISESNHRVLYPAFASGRVLRFVEDLLGAETGGPPAAVTVFFLFTGGSEPLDVTVFTPNPQSVRVTPRTPPNLRVYRRLRDQWWREYHAAIREQTRDADYPPLIQTYLSAMLSRRLGLESPLLTRQPPSERSELQQTMELIAGVESMHLETLRRTASAPTLHFEPAEQPPPAEIVWEPVPTPPSAADVAIEPIANRVPHECFYVRFGSFTNYLWLDKLQREYGGDISRMITLRGYDPQFGDRIQRQLALRQSALTDLMGPAAISDLAIFGRDLFVKEGAALAVLFQARNTALLKLDFQQQRTEAVAELRDAGAAETTVSIAGHDVSLIATPDNRLRSFYVVHGDYHLVTNCRKLAERFLAIADGDGAGSLGASAEFRHARTLMPVDREDTIFAYLPSAFQQGLLSPQYQIELQRRLRAVTDIELVQLAQLAARTEGKRHQSIQDLIRAELLPPGFDARPDGSHPAMLNGRLGDSLRGGRGTFLPVPDVPLRAVTASEAAWYSRCAAYYTGQWQQMDPLMVGVKRYSLDGKLLERVVVDAYVSPFVDAKYGWLTSLLGPPTETRIRPAPGDVITVQAVVNGGDLSPVIPPHHLFVGIQDHLPLTELKPEGFLQMLKVLRTTPGYLGAWPKPGFLDWLPLNLGGGQADIYGFSQLPFGIWRRQWGGFSALAFDPQLLADVTPHLVPEQADTRAQVRVHADDLTRTRLKAWVNLLAFHRAYLASRGNVRLLNTLTQQLGVPREASLAEGERLLDAKLVCSLGGRYQQRGADGLWTSTAWPSDDSLTADYAAPLLDWFRGLDASLTKYGDRIVVHAQLDMQRKPTEPKIELPFFDLFGSGKDKKSSPASEPPPEEVGPPPAGSPAPLPPPTQEAPAVPN